MTLALAALAGASTSVGPCVAPRYLALAALAGDRRPVRTTVAFIAGIVVAYVLLGTAAGIAGAVAAGTTAIHLVLAATLIFSGIVTLVRDPQCCARAHRNVPSTASGAFALGAGSALVISPCCAPMLAAVAALGAFARDPLGTGTLLAAFALGHAAPLAVAGLAGTAAAKRVRRFAATGAPAIVAGTLMIALGAYYAVLA